MEPGFVHIIATEPFEDVMSNDRSTRCKCVTEEGIEEGSIKLHSIGSLQSFTFENPLVIKENKDGFFSVRSQEN
jgi:hypothetical protein